MDGGYVIERVKRMRQQLESKMCACGIAYDLYVAGVYAAGDDVCQGQPGLPELGWESGLRHRRCVTNHESAARHGRAEHAQ